MNIGTLGAALCFPIAAWQVWISSLPNYHLQHLFMWLALPFALWAWRQSWWTVSDVCRQLRPALPWLGLFLCVHFAASWYTAAALADPTPCRTAVTGSLKLLAQWPFLGVFAVLGLVLTREKASRRALLYGVMGTYIFLVIVVCLQIIYVYCRSPHGQDYTSPLSPMEPAWCTWLLSHISAVLKKLALVAEARWRGGAYDFYAQGAYALSLPRVNGIFEEASMLAAHTGVAFVPLAVGLLTLARHNRSIRWLWGAWVIFLSACGMLALCRSTTGQILLLPACGVWFSMLLRNMPVRRVLLLSGATLLCLATALTLIPQGPTSLVARLTNGYAHSGTPRAVVYRATLDIIVAHPLLGTGREAYLPLLYASEDYQKSKDVELRLWQKTGGGELSALLAFTARYGICVTLGVIYAFCLLLRRLRRLRMLFPQSRALTFAAPACAAWGVMSFVTLLGSYDPRNALLLLPLAAFYGIAENYSRRTQG